MLKNKKNTNSKTLKMIAVVLNLLAAVLLCAEILSSPTQEKQGATSAYEVTVEDEEPPTSNYKGVAFIGKICSGKSELAWQMASILFSPVISHADYLKEVAIYAYGMSPTEKDRTLLQSLGKKMREIDPNVFVNITLKRTRYLPTIAINDDTRFLNEIKKLSEEGWFLVRIHVDENIRQARIKTLYPNITEEQLTDVSEIEMDSEEAQMYYNYECANNNEQDVENVIKSVTCSVIKFK